MNPKLKKTLKSTLGVIYWFVGIIAIVGILYILGLLLTFFTGVKHTTSINPLSLAPLLLITVGLLFLIATQGCRRW